MFPYTHAPVLDHVPDLALHGEDEEGEEVEEEDGPVDRHVEELEEGHAEGHRHGLGLYLIRGGGCVVCRSVICSWFGWWGFGGGCEGTFMWSSADTFTPPTLPPNPKHSHTNTNH